MRDYYFRLYFLLCHLFRSWIFLSSSSQLIFSCFAYSKNQIQPSRQSNAYTIRWQQQQSMVYDNLNTNFHDPIQKPQPMLSSRRTICSTFCSGMTALLAPISLKDSAFVAGAVTSSSSNKNDNIIDNSVVEDIRSATKTLQTLIENWENAVIDCNYADVPRELLEQKNKEQLLEKASTFALFDKSVAVVTCKTSNKNIRDYLGRTGIGPVVGLNKKLRQGLDLLLSSNSNDDEDVLEKYVQATENIQQALSRADSYSYTAGGDYSALNNFNREDTNKILESNTNLKQVYESVQVAIDNLNVVLAILNTSSEKQ